MTEISVSQARDHLSSENALDRAALAQARDDDDTVPWEQVKTDLGLT